MRDRSMASAAYPVRALKRPVTVEGSWCGGGYRTHVSGYKAIIVMSDGSEVTCCAGPSGHKKQTTYIACATRKVAELNDAAGIPEAVR